MLQHKQVRVSVGNREAAVDEELAPLVEELWKADIATVLSCQENRPGVAWIMFDMPGDVCRFIDIVAEYDPERGSLYRRITGRDDDDGCWEYDLLPEDDGLYEEEEDGEIVEWHEGQVAFYFNTSVRFPRTDLPILLDRLKRHNERPCEEEEMVPLCPACHDELILDEVDYGDGLDWFSCPFCGKLFMEAEVLWEEESALCGD